VGDFRIGSIVNGLGGILNELERVLHDMSRRIERMDERLVAIENEKTDGVCAHCQQRGVKR
jgi:hypothetical protein